MKKISILCGDWHRNWRGLVGKLSPTGIVNRFEWKGHYQGRQGQEGKRYTVRFDVVGSVLRGFAPDSLKEEVRLMLETGKTTERKAKNILKRFQREDVVLQIVADGSTGQSLPDIRDVTEAVREIQRQMDWPRFKEQSPTLYINGYS